MNAAVPQTKERRFFAGLYLRTRTGARFWGWGQPELNEKQNEAQNETQNEKQSEVRNDAENRAQKVSEMVTRKEADPERPWASLAEWLRQAHSSTFSQNSSVKPEPSSATKAQEAERASPAQKPAPPATPDAKRRLRFVWDRKFIGLVIR